MNGRLCLPAGSSVCLETPECQPAVGFVLGATFKPSWPNLPPDNLIFFHHEPLMWEKGRNAEQCKHLAGQAVCSKGSGKSAVPLWTFSRTSSPLYPARQSPVLLQAPSWAHLSLQLQALPCACQPAASTALLAGPPSSIKLPFLIYYLPFLNEEGKEWIWMGKPTALWWRPMGWEGAQLYVYLLSMWKYVCMCTYVCVCLYVPAYVPVHMETCGQFLAFSSILGLVVYFMLIYWLFFVYEYVWPACLVPTEVRRGHQISWDRN